MNPFGAHVSVLLLVFALITVSAADSPFAGLTLRDHLDQPHVLSVETANRLVMLFAIESRVDGKAWDERLSVHLPANRALVRIMDAGAVREGDRPRLLERVRKALDGTNVVFLMDWQGAVRKNLGGAVDQVLVVASNPEGVVTARVAGLPTAANLMAALGFLGIVPNPPLLDEQVSNPKTDKKPAP